MAGVATYLLLRPVAPVRPVSAFKTHMRILSPLPKSTWRFRVSTQSPCENPLFAQKTQVSDRVCRPQANIQGIIDFLKSGAEAVIPQIIGKVVDFIANEGKHLFEVHDDLRWIKEELECMQCFLEDADSKQNTDARVGILVAEMRDVSYEVEDVIDSFIVSQRRRPELTEIVDTHHEVAKQIGPIKQKIGRISQKRETYGLRDINEGRQEASSSTTTLQERRQFFALLEDSEVVGLQEEIETVRKQLIYEEPRRRVISIVGMGGLGKTTLAKKVYHAVKDDFECHAFICLSQQYEIRDILMRIINCVMELSFEVIEKLSVEDLGKKLRDHLKEKRYLVVIDDVWSMEAWDTLKHVLPDGMKRSRVMLTTRTREVALHADPSSHPHEIRVLDDEKGWELFLKTVFPGENPSTACPLELQEIGKNILKKCGGLPLAILVLGSLLSRKKKTLAAWSKVLESVYRHLTKSHERCMEILALSYWDLPPHLKPCFLYLGLLPEKYEIHSAKLIRLWIAEGFIKQRENEIIEDVAEDYLEELVDRSMIQAIRTRSNGPVVKCRIHDLLRDLSISKATQNNFFTIHNVEGTCSFSATKVRRLALHCSIHGYQPTVALRSILSFSNSHISHSKFNRAKLLRVVSQDDYSRSTPVKTPILPENEIKNFILLRYLELYSSNRLVPSIQGLDSLQTLVLKALYRSLPYAISGLKQLRHLEAYGGYDQVGNLQVKNLTNLQTLCIKAGSWIEDGFGELTNLRKLEIDATDGPYHESVSDSIHKLKSLRSLSFKSESYLPLFRPFKDHLHLYHMSLDGKIQKLPEFPPNLADLILAGSNIEQDAISMLENLPQLESLELWVDSYNSKKMVLSLGGFAQLETLGLYGLTLEDWIVKEGALRSVESVKIECMTYLKTGILPQRIRDRLKRI
ncbi:Disease resistance protein [Cinnamomum micranthum f. kanehirae]|uniref:Disease resistance protein n=1 Tax=Cinnamomum micranthum f. kanehirae TaxID=337451 RepID=A0A443P0Q3_9MAGN|nr:Disease resistance protein [Cinnamomum micranthum f. kanehirae]